MLHLKTDCNAYKEGLGHYKIAVLNCCEESKETESRVNWFPFQGIRLSKEKQTVPGERLDHFKIALMNCCEESKVTEAWAN